MSKSEEDIEKALRFWHKVFIGSVIGFFVSGGFMIYFATRAEVLYGTIGIASWICFGLLVTFNVVLVTAYFREEQLKKKR